MSTWQTKLPGFVSSCFVMIAFGLGPEGNDTDPNPSRVPPRCPGYLVTFGALMTSVAWCDQASLAPFLYMRRVQGLDVPSAPLRPWIELAPVSPFPCPIAPFQMQK